MAFEPIIGHTFLAQGAILCSQPKTRVISVATMGATITASSPMFKRGNNLYLAVNLHILKMLKQREPCPKYESYFRVQSVDPDFEQRHQNVPIFPVYSSCHKTH